MPASNPFPEKFNDEIDCPIKDTGCEENLKGRIGLTDRFICHHGLNDFLLPEYSDIDAAKTAAVAGPVVRMLGHNADSMYHFAETIVSDSCRLFLR